MPSLRGFSLIEYTDPFTGCMCIYASDAGQVAFLKSILGDERICTNKRARGEKKGGGRKSRKKASRRSVMQITAFDDASHLPKQEGARGELE